MSANRVKLFIRNIVHNSNLNKVSCINNKKKYNVVAVKHYKHNMIIKRKFSSSFGHMPPKPDKDPNDFIYTFIGVVIGGYAIIKKNNT